MNLSPYAIRLLMDFYCLSENPSNLQEPLAVEIAQEFLKLEVIQPSREGKAYCTTALGQAWIKLILETPIPEVRYVDPRTESKPVQQWIGLWQEHQAK